jgi:hypothetical protein
MRQVTARARLSQLALDEGRAAQPIRRVREDHPERAHARRRQPSGERLLEVWPGNRGEHAAAVDGAQRRRRATVGETPERVQAERYDVAAGLTADVGDEPDAACIVSGRRLFARRH